MTTSAPLSAADAPSIALHASDGAFARIHLDGGHVTTWIPAGTAAGSAANRLFVSDAAWYGPGCAIRGGIPVLFPQFGPFGTVRHHGFARLSRWALDQQFVEAGGVRALLRLGDTEETRAQWPFSFSAQLSVHVAGASLTVELTITNTDRVPFSFTAALHPYFAVEDAYATHVTGLSGSRYRDSLRNGAEFHERSDVLAIEGHIDRVYFATDDIITLKEPHRSVRIEKRGFPDTVVWNPGTDGTRERADFVPGDEHHMVCVEAAVVRPPVVLAPSEQWIGTQIMTAVD